MSLEVINGEFSYPGAARPILSNVNLALEYGQLLAILGPNGAGKTTLMRTMIGLQRWTRGDTRVDGINLGNMTPRQIGQTIAYVPQARSAMSLSLTGLDMVQIGRAARLGSFSQPGSAEREMAGETLKKIGAGHLADMLCSTMSGGQFQMILIARALVVEPKILVLDEPETGLDFRNQLVVLQLLRHLADSGLIVVMNTHYPAHAIRIADQVLLLDSQHRTLSGSTAEILTESHLSNLFDVDVRIVRTCFAGAEVPTVIPVSLQR